MSMGIYLDNNATTAISLPVLQKQVLALKKIYGNPSAPYELGVVAKRELEEARDQIFNLLGTCSDAGKIILILILIILMISVKNLSMLLCRSQKTFPKGFILLK